MKKIAIFGSSFNPPGSHHLAITRKLISSFGKVVIIPRGTAPNKPSIAETTLLQRKTMVKLAFSGLPEAEIDFFDLDNGTFTPTWMIDKKYKARFPDSEIWHVVGGDLIKGGADGNSEIQKKWQKGQEIWRQLNWVIIDHPGLPVKPEDLPPQKILLKMKKFDGRSTEIRKKVAANQSIGGLVPPEVGKYIIKNNLYK